MPLEKIWQELQTRLFKQPDFITLGGSGEPTLFSRTGELIDRIKTMTKIPVAILTNGSLLWKENVRKQLLKADLVIPSLDAGDEEMFQAVNRPQADITFRKMLEGLIRFRQEYQGQYWLEVLLIEGYTATETEAAKIAKCAALIKPKRIQLNTVTRPPAEKFALNVSPTRLTELAKLFNPTAEVIADFENSSQPAEFSANREEILNLLRRRPCSLSDIANGLGLHRNEVLKHIEKMAAQNQITKSSIKGAAYYAVKGGSTTNLPLED